MLIYKLIFLNFSRVLYTNSLSEILLVTVLIQQCKVNEFFFSPVNAMKSYEKAEV
jgi:hypothetical protein